VQKAVENFLFGLCFGMGFCVAAAMLHLIAGLLGSASMQRLP
jgi:hypothetical protein